MANFEIAYRETIRSEGGYSNHPSDRGCETWRGIARNMWPKWEGWMLIDEIKANCGTSLHTLRNALEMDDELKFKVRNFYKTNFWDRLSVEGLSDRIAAEIYDTAVNQGRRTAIKYFQQALNMLNDNQRHYSDIVADGVMGSKTLHAYIEYMNTAVKIKGRNEDLNTKVLLKALNGLQFERYKAIVDDNPGQEAFFYGWIQRT